MAGLRNILIHEYIRVDVSRIKDMLENHLDDFVEFMRYIQAYLEKKGSNPLGSLTLCFMTVSLGSPLS
jgi:uncharacterized protein YutE (UPF0331/DUF86 family)